MVYRIAKEAKRKCEENARSRTTQADSVENPTNNNMAVVRKKQDDKNLKTLRELITSGGSGGNRQCFDCGQKGPTYVNMTIGSFVCTRCSGVLRGLTPPHRVKSISMATFTPEEIDFLKAHGNELCAKTWLGLWDPKRIIHQDQRELMIDKYERKRYYLEPASPLKSLTNSAAAKAPPPTLNGSIVNGTSNGIHLNGNSNANNTSSNSSKQTIENNLKNITLTPPSTLHLSNNSINSNSSSTNNNRQQNRYNFQNQFTPDENSFFDSTTTSTANKLQNNNNNNNNIIMNGASTNSTSTSHLTNGGVNDIANHLNNCQISNKNSLNLQNCDNSNFISNKFTPDSEFIADFGSASIFNAVNNSTSAASNANNGSNKLAGLNGFKIHQNGTNSGTNHINANNFVNGSDISSSAVVNSGGKGLMTNGNCNGNSATSNVNVNFADFDHASIYNAAAYQPSIYNNAAFTKTSNNNNNNNNLFANNYSYGSELFNSDSFSTNTNSALNYNNNSNIYGTVQTANSFFSDVHGINSGSQQQQQQAHHQNQYQQFQQPWNTWQQFQSPLSTPTSEQSRWSLPMSLNSTSNSLSSSATFTSNSSINSTPPADRYAALKDLDDQLRESKTSLNGSNYGSPAPAAASPNPFSQSTPITIAGSNTAQSQQVGNPFQTSFNPQSTKTANLFATNNQASFFDGNNPPFNTFTQQSLLAYDNGYAMGGSCNGQSAALLTNGGTLNNGNGGLAYAPQQVTTGGNAAMTSMKNPFATMSSVSCSNNPFL